MSSKRSFREKWAVNAGFGFLALATLASAGCNLGEAAVDGVYGGIADAIATLVSAALLSVAGL